MGLCVACVLDYNSNRVQVEEPADYLQSLSRNPIWTAERRANKGSTDRKYEGE